MWFLLTDSFSRAWNWPPTGSLTFLSLVGDIDDSLLPDLRRAHSAACNLPIVSLPLELITTAVSRYVVIFKARYARCQLCAAILRFFFGWLWKRTTILEMRCHLGCPWTRTKILEVQCALTFWEMKSNAATGETIRLLPLVVQPNATSHQERCKMNCGKSSLLWIGRKVRLNADNIFY